MTKELDLRAHRFEDMLRGYNSALEAIDAATSHVQLWHGKPHPQKPDTTTLQTLALARKVLVADLEHVKRLVDSAQAIADAHQGSET